MIGKFVGHHQVDQIHITKDPEGKKKRNRELI